MELYVLNNALQREHVYDRYVSLIWTERTKAFGDFQLIVPADTTAKNRLRLGAYLALSDSKRMMRIETRSEKNGLLTLSGRSIESLFMYRPLSIGHTVDFDDVSKFGFRATSYNAMVRIYNIAMGIDVKQESNVETIGYVPNTTRQANGIPVGDTHLTDMPTYVRYWDNNPEPLYDMMIRVADSDTLGFAYTRNHSTNLLDFSVFRGLDRTSSQSVRPAVIFSSDTDTLDDPSRLESIENHANAAFITSLYSFTNVYPSDQDPNLARGLNLRQLVLTPKTNEEYYEGESVETRNERIRQIEIGQAYTKLFEHRKKIAIDGTVPITRYKYDRDYMLNDRVELRVDGLSKWMRVAEHTYTSDAQGDRSFPTLEEESLIFGD